MEFITKSSNETKDLGNKLATDLRAKIIALSGDLGSGKTTFVQGFAEGLGITQKISSPTFILMRKYKDFYHVDLYRLEENVENEVKNLGLPEIWKENGNVVLIEWAEKIKDILPKNTIWINFEVLGENERRIVVNYNFKL